jgi:rhamnose utilization protein RhaD (predicted bifunctional aldolase and dehydrogenase)
LILEILDVITELSHEFGTDSYVRGGGGNTSCKNETTLWVKPSGTTLAALTPERFVALDRAALGRLYALDTPQEPAEREALVKAMMEQALLPGTAGRASVEAPLHDSLGARYVVHTHPCAVNGMTCSRNGRDICARLFPDALWLDYIDPGYTLCRVVRGEIQRYRAERGAEPELIFLKNHGVFVAAESPERLRELYAEIMGRLNAEYAAAGITVFLECSQPAAESTLAVDRRVIREALGRENLHIVACGAFDIARGPISPDHMVYAKAYPYIGVPTAEGIAAFVGRRGYAPQVFSFNQSVFGVAESETGAALALELAKDGALVEKLAAAFGGIEYMDDQARDFIENWEVESYRKKQMQ